MTSPQIEANMDASVEMNAANSEQSSAPAQASSVFPVDVVAVSVDEAMNEVEGVEDGEVEEEEESEDDDDEDDEEDENTVAAVPTPAVSLVGDGGRPLSDFEVAARYAAIEIQSISSQFSATVVDASKPAATPILPGTTTHGSVAVDGKEEAEEDSDDEPIATIDDSSSDSDSSDDENGNDDENPQKLRAEIEAAMEREENKVAGPLKTPNEIPAPIREPEVELTPDCPIARCGIVLNVSRPGLMVTVKSDANAKPLDEGSVLCFEDRTVIGCVDEVFGPVMMPMYLVRFETADKIPAQTDLNKVVFYATQHTTYIVPENIRDKGTDASNIFDEETDETVYSDDEAEAAAKRRNKKRNRIGEQDPASAHTTNSGNNPHSRNNFSDYQPGAHRSTGGGRGRGRGRGPSHGDYHHQHQGPMQTQAHGGFTRYTSQGFNPHGGAPYPPATAAYPPGGQYGAPQYAPPQFAHAPPPTMYGQAQYGGLAPYPPQAPPPYYGQPPQQSYAPPPMPQHPPQYGPPPGYYQQPDHQAYGHHGHHAPPPPPPPGYGPPRGRR